MVRMVEGAMCRMNNAVPLRAAANVAFSNPPLLMRALLVLLVGMFSLILGCTCSGRSVVKAEQQDADRIELNGDTSTADATGKPTSDMLPDILVVPSDVVESEGGSPDIPIPPDAPAPPETEVADVKETETPDVPLPPKDTEVGGDGTPPDVPVPQDVVDGEGIKPGDAVAETDAVQPQGICPPEQTFLIDDFSGPDFPECKGFGDNGLWIGLNGFSIKVQNGVLRAEGTVDGAGKWPGFQVHNWGVPALDVSQYSGIRFKVRGHIEGGLDGKQMVKVAAFENAGQVNTDQPAASAVMHIAEKWKAVQLDIRQLKEIRQFQVLAAVGEVKPGSWIEIDDVELTTDLLVDNFSKVGELFTDAESSELYCPLTDSYWYGYDAGTQLSVQDGALHAEVNGAWTGFQVVAWNVDISNYGCLKFDIRGGLTGVDPDKAVKVEVYDESGAEAAPKAFGFVPVTQEWQTIEVDLGFPAKPDVLEKLQFIAAGVAAGGWFEIDNVALR